MRDSRIRLTVLMALMLTSVMSSSLWADDPRSIWPTYHADMYRQGINHRAVDINNPASLNLIWVFPRATEDAAKEEYKYIADNMSPLFTGIGAWRQGYDSNAWGYSTAGGMQENNPLGFSFLWALAVNADATSGAIAKAVWRFPSGIPKGEYQISVWVPPVPAIDINNPTAPTFTYTTRARYSIFDAAGQSTAIFDQTQGGTWQLLSANPYEFTGNGDLRIEMTNLTADTAADISAKSIRVAADAIKFIPVTGQQIYSSPTSAEIDFNYTSPTNSTLAWSGRIPVVYTGTVEPPFVRSGGASDTGSIYCINSITPDDRSFGTDTLHTELSKLLGTPVWRYPGYGGKDLESLNAAQGAAFLAKKNAGIIGPLEGGIYSSVTLAHVPSLQSTGQDQFIAIATGMDRQVYAFDAQNGDLLFKGPGATVSEDAAPITQAWTTEPDPASGKLRNDAFGGQYHWTQAGSGSDIIWDFASSANSPLNKTGSLGASRSYSVYVWIPVAKGSELRVGSDGSLTTRRITDAVYTVTYEGGTTTAKINQRRVANQGSWVKLGSWFGVSKVSLSASAGSTDPADSIVVADAVMVVPDTIGVFSYCTAATDVAVDPTDMYQQTGNFRATMAFACTALAGRLVCFDLQHSLSNAANGDSVAYLKWVYPDIRSTNVISDPNNNTGGDQPDMGSIGASPTFYDGLSNEMVYVPTLGGTIHCVRADTGSLLGTFSPSSPSSGPPGDPTVPPDDLTNTVGFTSSATIGQTDSGAKCLFIGSVDGTFYALNPEPDVANKKLLPRTTYQPGTPYGAFRFSTPSTVAQTNSNARVWAASTDGHIYALKADAPGSPDFLTRIPKSDTVPVFTEPSVLTPIQSSPAFDGYGSMTGKNFITMYVGDMNGALHWFDAITGQSNWTFDPSLIDGSGVSSQENFTSFQCEGPLFSSPNVTSFRAPMSGNGTLGYLYTGCSDGRVYALSQYGGAWGGYWAGGYWPLREGGPNRPIENSNTRLAPDTDVQVDLFNNTAAVPYYDLSRSEDPNPMEGANHLSTRADKTPWNLNWAVSAKMKMPEPSPKFPTSDGVTNAQIVARNAAIDTYLTKEARARRVNPYIYPVLADRTAGGAPIYCVWGETLNVVIWNLPALEYISGGTIQSAASSLVFNLANTSPGSSSGTLIHQTGAVTLKEYVVLDKDNPVKDATTGAVVPDAYNSLRYGGNTVVKRCYAIAQVYLDPKRNPPFSPGPGWTLVVDVKRKRDNAADSPLITQRIPIAKLVAKDGLNVPDFDQEQNFGINNPLAISDDQGGDIGSIGNVSVAWPNVLLGGAYTVTAATRRIPAAHFNGNASMDDQGNYLPGSMPFINFAMVNHGSSSREARLYAMDISGVGTKLVAASTPMKIDNFRISGGDLLFRGGSDAINASGGCWLPWEFGPSTADYPNLYRQRQEMRKASDDGLPVEGNTALPPVVGGIPPGKLIGSYEGSTLQPETVFASVDVPRFQPANSRTPASSTGLQAMDYDGRGYTRTMSAYIDSNGDGNLDTGNQVVGRPTVYQEVYRRFAVGVMIPPDPKIEVDESLVDQGIAPHALGEQMIGMRGFSPFNPAADIQQWFKPVTIKNAGNVNLPNMQIGKSVMLYGDQTSRTAPISGAEIVSSLDPLAANTFFPQFKADPFTTGSFGYTLSKARVGEPDPTQMSIPDHRKWDLNFAGTKAATTGIWDTVNAMIPNSVLDPLPLPVRVATRVPITQPIGTYQSLWAYTDGTGASVSIPYIPVFSDKNGDGNVDFGSEPVAQKSFQLKVTVKETQLTGGQTPTSLVQIDPDGSPKFGQGTPAAYRDSTNGSVLLVYSTNGVVSPADAASMTSTQRANAPWMLFQTLLTWDKGTWQTTGAQFDRWWTSPWDNASPFIYPGGWPDPLLGSYAGWNKLSWTGANTTLPSVRHFAPVFATYNTKVNGKDVTKSWLVWVGSVDIQDDATGKVAQEYRLFYTDSTGCDASRPPMTIDHNPAMVKRYPSVAYDSAKGRLWTGWQGGEEGKWGLYATVTDNPDDPASWTSDMKMIVPDCLASVSSPNLIMRPPWSNDLQAIYAGSTKLGQTSDIMLTCYNPVSQIDVSNGNATPGDLPSNFAKSMPRVMDEKLERDSKYAFYNSRHLAWIRPEPGATLKVDNWNTSSPPPDTVDFPAIHVVLPIGYPVPSDCPSLGGLVSNGKTTEQIAISGTDGSVWHRATDSADWVLVGGFGPLVPPTTPAMTMEVDDATGLYVYKYPSGSVAASILGEMLVDYSAGIVRVTKTLSEQRVGDSFLSAEVWADYTPRTMRLTTDKAADSSPRAFIEKTQMNCHTMPTAQDPNPGLGAKWRSASGFPPTDQPVDRLWVFWRKAATGAQSSTIYYATYRAGFDLSDLFKRNHVSVNPNATYRITDVTGTNSPWEIDGGKTKVYITAGGNSAVIHYAWTDSNGNVQTGSVPGAGYGWVPELKEQSLLGFAADGNVNEGSIYAFADPVGTQGGNGTFGPALSSKIWLFWTSTRAGTANLFWETFCPDFAAR